MEMRLKSEIKAEGQTPEAMRASVWEKQKALELDKHVGKYVY